MKTWFATWDCSIPELKSRDAEQAAEVSMDDEAFAALYERTARPLWAYLARVSGNYALADDLLQETYLRFLGAKPPEGEIAGRRYLFRIASNLLRDHWRRPELTPIEDLPEAALAKVNPLIGADKIDAQAALASAFPRLRPRERQLLWLAYAEGATHREISQITGVRETSVKLLLFRAKHKLARYLRIRIAAPERRR
jgi:RNA polymerase sigma-70 factor (ECF subfamily)